MWEGLFAPGMDLLAGVGVWSWGVAVVRWEKVQPVPQPQSCVLNAQEV